ncbi:urease accessory protein UreF [Phormidium tenue]|jgi:urease accessory protein|uniref:Urease accessory protein UreF n=1 Tax=Phormidium tenue FACHB-1050 TaxID=2692857 RepID=A0ABR8CEZ4_9CYAN|nr:urease accessory protein UreF [Phormidium tenue]MBD2318515.1 urease accessory protein UreF [Phormidium tenue FACHB-1050]
MIINPDSYQLLRLLQLTSPALPVGAYSYSEGIEYLCSNGTIQTESDLCDWLQREMHFGFVTNEAAIALRAHQALMSDNITALNYWNNWLSATRETEEVRLASWQMGQSLMKLWRQLPDHQEDQLAINKSINELLPTAKENSLGQGCNYAIAFGIVAASLGIDASNTTVGYLYSWLSNLVSAAVRSVPFGQTTGQQVIFRLSSDILRSSQLALKRLDDELEWCGWGASLACANHETQYSRLFRS